MASASSAPGLPDQRDGALMMLAVRGMLRLSNAIRSV
jgi:hypothetical protein